MLQESPFGTGNRTIKTDTEKRQYDHDRTENYIRQIYTLDHHGTHHRRRAVLHQLSQQRPAAVRHRLAARLPALPHRQLRAIQTARADESALNSSHDGIRRSSDFGRSLSHHTANARTVQQTRHSDKQLRQRDNTHGRHTDSHTRLDTEQPAGNRTVLQEQRLHRRPEDSNAKSILRDRTDGKHRDKHHSISHHTALHVLHTHGLRIRDRKLDKAAPSGRNCR